MSYLISELKSKDLFSGHSQIYAAFRPTYPEALYDFIFSFCKEKQNTWDCATGNGQIAKRLANTFESVIATDISEQQLANAPELPNVKYLISSAEETLLPDNSFDLITVGQALHWFQTDRFFREVQRVGRTGGVFAAWGYAHLQINSDVDAIVTDYYNNVVGQYWDPARRLVESRYSTISFPFKLIETPDFFIETEWTARHLLGYLESWSATQAYIKAQHRNPVSELGQRIAPLWPEEKTLPVSFPIFLKMGLL